MKTLVLKRVTTFITTLLQNRQGVPFVAQEGLERVKIFPLIHFSSDANEHWRQLLKHLASLKARSDVLLYDSEILPGKDYTSEINTRLHTANIILFLVSPDFIVHYYHDNRVVRDAIKRYDEEQVRIIPILLMHADWKRTSFAKFWSLPQGNRFVSEWTWTDRDIAYPNIVEGITKVVDEIVDEVRRKKAADEADKQNYINNAKAHSRNGDYQQALISYDHAIQIDSRDASLHEDKGDLQFALKRFEDALASYETAFKLTPRPSGQLWGKKGRALFNLGRYQIANNAYQQAIQRVPSDAELFIGQGDVQRALGLIKNATASYERSRRLNPSNAQIHIRLGDVYLESKDIDLARASYEEAYKLEPANAQACLKLGDIYFRLLNYPKAIDYYEQASILQPRDATIYRSKARAQFALAKSSHTHGAYYKLALETYKLALARDANDPDTYKDVGDLFLHLQQLDKALDAYKEAVRLKPDFSQVLRRQGEIFDRKADELKECARQVRKKADDLERRKGR